MLVRTELFGGAITADYPEGYIDASYVIHRSPVTLTSARPSLIRQVPDTQEVYLSSDSNDSIVLETLSRVSVDDSSDAAKFHFDSIAHDNEALSSSVEDVHIIPNDRGDGDETPSVIILRGQQAVQKFNSTSVDDVRIFLALYRVEEKGVDLVLTLNFPMDVGGTRTEERYLEAQRDFYSIATSLRIVDSGLFA